MCSWSSSPQHLPFVGDRFFTSAKQLRKCASNTISSILQRGAGAQEMGEGLSQEGPIESCWITLGPYFVVLCLGRSQISGAREMEVARSLGVGACVEMLQKPVLEKPSTTFGELENSGSLCRRASESWRTQVHYAGGPRGVNTPSSEP